MIEKKMAKKNYICKSCKTKTTTTNSKIYEIQKCFDCRLGDEGK